MNLFKSKIFKFGLPVVLIATGLLFVFAQFYFSGKSSVLYKYKDRAAVDPADELYVIFNPFRDKTPEIEAEKVFESLKIGNCEQIEPNVKIDCERENQYKLKSWDLADRVENGDQINLHYKVYRQSHNHYSNVWINLEKVSDKWKVTSYETWY